MPNVLWDTLRLTYSRVTRRHALGGRRESTRTFQQLGTLINIGELRDIPFTLGRPSIVSHFCPHANQYVPGNRCIPTMYMRDNKTGQNMRTHNLHALQLEKARTHDTTAFVYEVHTHANYCQPCKHDRFR